MKIPPLRALKTKLDAAFSIYIRQRGMDSNGFNRCVCCGASHHWKEGHCGHYYSRIYLPTRWDERNCHFCCLACNVWRRGNYPQFARFMQRTYPQATLDELDRLHRTTIKMTRSDYEGLIAKYRGLTEQGIGNGTAIQTIKEALA